MGPNPVFQTLFFCFRSSEQLRHKHLCNPSPERLKALGNHAVFEPKWVRGAQRNGCRNSLEKRGLEKQGLALLGVLADVPPERKPERGYIRMFPWNENRNEATFACSPGTKTGTRARSPKPPFYETALLSPSELFLCMLSANRPACYRSLSGPKSHESVLWGVSGAPGSGESKKCLESVPRVWRGYVRQNQYFTKPPFYLPVILGKGNE